MTKITCLIPTHNEAATIEPILQLVIDCSLIDQLIVVDDSTDGTKDILQRYRHKIDTLLLSSVKQGKGEALRLGAHHIHHPITLMLDGDIIGLTERHLGHMIFPVLKKKADMCIGIFYRGGDHSQFFRMNTIAISGQRAVNTDLLKKALQDPLSGYYGPEICLNFHSQFAQQRVHKVTLFGADDRPKFIKHGLYRGGREFLKETADVFGKYSQLYLLRYPMLKLGATRDSYLPPIKNHISLFRNRIGNLIDRLQQPNR